MAKRVNKRVTKTRIDKPNPKSNVNKKEGNPIPKNVGKKHSRNSDKSKPKRNPPKTKSDKAGKKSIQKSVALDKVHKQRQSKPKKSKAVRKGTDISRAKSGELFTPKQKRGSKRIDYEFKKVRSIDKKIDLFQQQSDKSLTNELRKRGGKPPRGFVLIMTDKDGNEKTFITPLDFVVNKANIKKFVAEKMAEMKDNFVQWSKMKKHMPKDLQQEMKEQGYGEYNPDDIHEMTIKFII